MQDNSANRQTLNMEHYLFYHATPLVKIVVGGLTEPERIFHVHEGLLVLRSDYFKSALHKHWASGVEKEVHLPEESAQAFGAFARWIYNDLDLVPDDYLRKYLRELFFFLLCTINVLTFLFFRRG